MEQLISKHFHQSIEAKIEHAEILVQGLQDAAAIISNCLLQEGKLLVCAEGISSGLANTLVHCMHNGQRFERPGLPTLALSPTLHGEDDANDPYSGQIRTLGKPEDVLMIISSGMAGSQIFSALVTAQEYGLQVVALTAPGSLQLTSQLRATDVELFANNDDQYRVQEIHLLIIFCLIELVDNHLFGETS